MTRPTCVVLVPVAHRIEPGCEIGLRGLEERGYEVRRVYGYSQIDVARSQMATDALADGFDELVWIDADVVFHPDDVGQLRSHGRPFVAGVYPKKGVPELAAAFLPGTEKVVLGEGGGLLEVRAVGFGFVFTHRTVFERVAAHAKLPVCNAHFGHPLVPYFLPVVAPEGSGWWYLGEDYAFCERARQAGVAVQADTSIRLWHVGNHPFAWEDAGTRRELFRTYHFHLAKPKTDGSQ